MRILQLMAGTGNFYCGSCLRDQTLYKTLRKRGHEVLVAPLYLPPLLDDQSQGGQTPIFFGGINVYLQQKWSMFRRLPGWMTRILDSPRLLRLISRRSEMTKASELGEMTVSMLRGEDGNQRKALEEMIGWLREHYADGKPDVIILANALLVGLARELKQAFGVPVVCTLQGEDTFLDGLDEPHRGEAWDVLAGRAKDIDRFIAISEYYKSVMQPRIKVSDEMVTVVHNGIDLAEFDKVEGVGKDGVTVGYLARICPIKGLHTLVDAFIELKRHAAFTDVRLKVAGAVTAADVGYVSQQKNKLEKAGLMDEVTFYENVSYREKIEFLQSLTLFSVPAGYGEAFGLYVVEAMAAGVPVVQPDTAAFTEVVEKTGGGVLFQPEDASDLAAKIGELLQDENELKRLGANARAGVEQGFTAEVMAEQVERVLGECLS